MIRFVLMICFLGSVLSTDPKTIEIEDFVEGYYWRVYKGKIPRDALKGGLDKDGEPTYIGQTLFGDIIISGEMHKLEETLHFEYGNKVHSTKDNIKILCTHFPEQFEWIQTNKRDLKYMKDEVQKVKGGYEEADYFVGRIALRGKTIVGKVYIHFQKNDRVKGGIYVANDDKPEHHTKDFEVLIYNSSIPIKVSKSVTVTVA